MLIETLKYPHCKAQSCYSNSVSCIRCSNFSSMKNYRNYACRITSKPQMLNYTGIDFTNVIYTNYLSLCQGKSSGYRISDIGYSPGIPVGGSFLCRYLLRIRVYTSQVSTACMSDFIGSRVGVYSWATYPS
jgi:hypothetical protein